MNIAILKDWNTTYEEFADSQDGIVAAFREISKKHNTILFTKLGNNNYTFERFGLKVVSTHEREPWYQAHFGPNKPIDAIVAWGSLDRPWHNNLNEFKGPRVLCHAGGTTTHPNVNNFDVFCCESQVYIDRYKSQGKRAIRAFGTNTDLFKYESKSPKFIKALYPASFCFHKNHELFAKAVSGNGLCVGNFNEEGIVGRVQQLGCPVIGRVSSEALRDLYRMSRCVVIPSGPEGGSQRVVLEAMACGVPVLVAEDNDKCVEFVKESGFGGTFAPFEIELREAIESITFKYLDPMVGVNYVKSKWTHHHYADAILEAIGIAKSPESVV